jgi:hypothetical protein
MRGDSVTKMMVKGRWVAKVERLMAKQQRLVADLERLVISD